MIHTSYLEPRCYTYNGAGVAAEIDRLQELNSTGTLNRTKINEIGRDGIVDWKESIPSVTVNLRQYEYGNLEFWKKLANAADADTSVNLTDFKTSAIDIAAYETDDSGTFVGTVWYPKLRTSSFSINIADPDALIERNFTLVGEDEKMLREGCKYLIYLEKTVESGEDGDVDIVIGSGDYANYPAPAENPDESATYMLRVTRSRSGVASDLTTYTYVNGTTTLTVPDCEVGDIIKVYYAAASYITGGDPFVENDSDSAGLSADCASIYLEVSNYAYRLQSATSEVTFDRADYKEIGNTEVVSRGVNNITTRITLGRFMEDYTIEEVLRGAAGTDYGIIDIREFADDISLHIKIYATNAKSSFLIGYKFTNLSPASTGTGATANDYASREVVLEGEEGLISTSESDFTT